MHSFEDTFQIHRAHAHTVTNRACRGAYRRFLSYTDIDFSLIIILFLQILHTQMVTALALTTLRRLDVHAMVAKKGPPTLFITIKMNSQRQYIYRLGLGTD